MESDVRWSGVRGAIRRRCHGKKRVLGRSRFAFRYHRADKHKKERGTERHAEKNQTNQYKNIKK